MNRSSKNNIWNRRKRKVQDENLEEDGMIHEADAEDENMILRVQHRLGVSREEARNIIRNADLI